MKGLTTALLDRACRIFLELAYPEGRHTIPPPKDAFLALPLDQPPETVLRSSIGQPLPAPCGGIRGYTLRLGSAAFPHLKLQIVQVEDGSWVFSVDTHDAIVLDPLHPDFARWTELQRSNRGLKEQIELAWENAGLLTFNALLRRELTRH
jgi:hypothetical protein